MIPLGILTDEISQDVAHALDVAVELGFSYVELRSFWEKNIIDLSDSEVVQVKRLITDRGLQVCAIASPFFKCDLDLVPSEGETETPRGDLFYARGGNYTEQIEMLERSIELAQTFGTRLVRSFSFWKRNEPAWERDEVMEIWETMINRFREPLRLAEEADVIMALENEHDCNIATSDEIVRLFQEVRSDHLGLIWDPGNAFCAGEIRPYPDGYERIKPYICHVHVKDVHRDPGTGECEWRPIGGGAIDYPGQFQALRADGYAGVITLETHYRPPEGSPEAGTRESFAGLRRILEELEQKD